MKRFILNLIACLFFGGACAQSSSAKFENLNNEEFKEKLKIQDIQLIDVRTPQEFSTGFIPGAINMDINQSDFSKQIEKLDKDNPVLVYCRSGARSRKAAAVMAAEGFVVYNLDKGILNWNGPVVKK